MARLIVGTRVFSVLTEGADPTGVADSKPAFQAAMSAAAAAGGGTVLVPAGTYRMNSTATVLGSGVVIEGAGIRRSVIVNHSTNAPAIAIDGDADPDRLYQSGARGLTFASGAGVAGVAGQCGLYVRKIGKGTFESLSIASSPAKLYDGLKFENVSQSRLDWLHGDDTLNDGIYIKDCIDIFGHGARADANGRYGFRIVDSEGLYLHAWAAYGNATNAWKIEAGGSADNKHFLFVNCVGDTSGNDNWSITNLARASFVSCWAAAQLSTATNTAACGMHLSTSAVRAIRLISCWFQANNGHGLRLNTNTTAPDSVECIGCTFGEDTPAGNGNGKGGSGYGLSISNESTNVSVQGGRAAGNATGAIDPGASASVAVRNVQGYLSANDRRVLVKRQAANLTNSSSSVVQNSDLTFTLAAGKSYKLNACLIFSTDTTTTGVTLRLDYGANAAFVGTARAILAAAGASAEYQNRMNASGHGIYTGAVLAANEKYLGEIEGIFTTTDAESTTLKLLSEVDGSTVTLHAGSFAELIELT